MSVEAKKSEEKPEKEKEKEVEKNEDNIKTKETVLEVKIENDDETKSEEPGSLSSKLRQHWQLIIKTAQLIVCILCLSFFFQPANFSANIARRHLEEVALIFLAFCGYILINAVLIVSHLLKDKIPFRISTVFSLIAALLFFVAGILLIVDRKNKFQGATYEPHMYLASMLTTATVLSFINAIFFAVDGVYTFILKKDF